MKLNSLKKVIKEVNYWHRFAEELQSSFFNCELIMLTADVALDDDVGDGVDLSLYIILRS